MERKDSDIREIMAILGYAGPVAAAMMMSLLPGSESLSGGSPGLKIVEAVEKAARKRHLDYLKGKKACRSAAPSLPETGGKEIWREGSSRLLDFSQKRGRRMLFVSPLVNRAFILSMGEDNGFMGELARAGFSPLLVDWGEPGEAERGFGIEDYLARLRRMAGFIGGRLALGGYCMGGVMALMLAEKMPEAAESVALIATPWDFHAGDRLLASFPAGAKKELASLLSGGENISGDIINALFFMKDPWVAEARYRKLAQALEERKIGERALRDFAALDLWANSGVPMAAKLARECVIGWGVENALAGKEIRLDIPAFLAIARKDKVVPPESSLALLKSLPRARVSSFEAGHVGLVTAEGPRKALVAEVGENVH